MIERRAVVDHESIHACRRLAVVARVDEVAADLPTPIRRVARVADTVAPAVVAADGAGQVLVQWTRDERVLADETVIRVFHLVAAFKMVAARARDVVDRRTEAVRVQDAARAALHGLHAVRHQIVADEHVIVQERRFRFLVRGQAVDQLRREAEAAHHGQPAHRDVVAGLTGRAALRIDARQVAQQVGGTHRRQALDIVRAQRVDRERRVFLRRRPGHARHDDDVVRFVGLGRGLRGLRGRRLVRRGAGLLLGEREGGCQRDDEGGRAADIGGERIAHR